MSRKSVDKVMTKCQKRVLTKYGQSGDKLWTQCVQSVWPKCGQIVDKRGQSVDQIC
jgi:hypothetical protein